MFVQWCGSVCLGLSILGSLLLLTFISSHQGAKGESIDQIHVDTTRARGYRPGPLNPRSP